MITLLSADEWIEKYRPEMENGVIKMYETFGEEFASVKASDPRKIWTLICEESDAFIESGYRWINRLCYFITEVPWEEGRYWDNAIIVNWGSFEND